MPRTSARRYGSSANSRRPPVRRSASSRRTRSSSGAIASRFSGSRGGDGGARPPPPTVPANRPFRSARTDMASRHRRRRWFGIVRGCSPRPGEGQGRPSAARVPGVVWGHPGAALCFAPMALAKVARDAATLRGALAPRRAGGARIVFTNGCFDLLHPGHVRYLAAARALGDVLVVGLNDDASVRRLKGPGRPILGATERVEVLAALSAVDHLVLFADDTPGELMAALAPGVLVKGADWSSEEIVGRDLVLARGGRVERIPLVPGVSTSDIIRRIRSGC